MGGSFIFLHNPRYFPNFPTICETKMVVLCTRGLLYCLVREYMRNYLRVRCVAPVRVLRKVRMKANVLRMACVAGLTVACAWGLAGCGAAETSGVKLTGGVAATVNDAEIAEDDVTLAIESTRENIGLNDADSWASYLNSVGETPASVREQVLETFITKELVHQGAAEQGISIDAAEIDEHFNSTKANYSSDEKWEAALEEVGMTADEYRENIEYSLLVERLKESMALSDNSDPAEVAEFVRTQAANYDGAKRSSHILFDSDDEATAQDVLNQLNAGTLDFAEAAKQYSQDSSAENGGDVGWDALSTFVDDYQDALDGLEKDQISGLVVSQYGIHIIKCTDVFVASDDITSADQLPEGLAEEVSEAIEENSGTEAYQAWLETRREEANVVINDMPEGVPYNVDMSQFDEADEGAESGDDASADDTAAAEGDAAATDDAASAEDGAAAEESGEGNSAEKQDEAA